MLYCINEKDKNIVSIPASYTNYGDVVSNVCANHTDPAKEYFSLAALIEASEILNSTL